MNLLEELRAATGVAHEALHHHRLLAPLASETVTLEDYRYALLAFDAFYSAMEPTPLSGSAPVRTWLAHDLEAQGLNSLSPTIEMPVITSDSELWGYLYVKQGSTLGGSVMSKTLRRALGLQPLIDQRFFAGYGDQNGVEWKKFIETLFLKAPNLRPADTVHMAVASFQAIADVCDAVLALKDTHALQAPTATE